MRPKVYIDGHVGTTGLRIREWLGEREDIEVLSTDEELRKDAEVRRECLRAAEIAILCLPDEAAREAAAWAEGAGTRIIDASTAHRVAEGWVYGLPELAPGQREKIARAKYVSNPGCYASGFVLSVRPLVDAGFLAADAALCIHGVSGYSGGGRQMIEKWEDPAGRLISLPFEAPYALERVHKHIPEMIQHTGLRLEPQFTPAVGPFRTGMRVLVPLHATLLRRHADGQRICDLLKQRYESDAFVRVGPVIESAVGEFDLDPRSCNDTNRIDMHVLPQPSGHVLLVAILDNLGKGAAGVAIQNLNLMLGLPEDTGLRAI